MKCCPSDSTDSSESDSSCIDQKSKKYKDNEMYGFGILLNNMTSIKNKIRSAIKRYSGNK